MGVHGLWQLLQSSGRPVNLETLDGKILAVDVSLWLHQTMKGMRDKDGNPLPNAHLHGLFTRICKLLFYRIKPVFVFDGGVPALKKQTIAARREKKDFAEKESGRANKKLLENLMKSHAVKAALGIDTSFKYLHRPSTSRKPDVFELAPFPDVDKGSNDALNYEDEFEEERMAFINLIEEKFHCLENVDPESSDFKSLPPEIQHEILTEMKEVRKKYFVITEDLPEDTDDFSSFQISKLMKRSKLTSQIKDVRKVMNDRSSGEITGSLGLNVSNKNVKSSRVVSEDGAHYILIKGLSSQQQIQEARDCEKILAQIEEMEPKPKKTKKACDEESSNDEISSELDELMLGTEEERLREKYKQKLQEVDKNLKAEESDNSQDNTMAESKSFLPSADLDNNSDVEIVAVTSRQDDSDDSSLSDDEGFIEVTLDPTKGGDDDLFPAAMFNSAVKKDFIEELEKLKEKKIQKQMRHIEREFLKEENDQPSGSKSSSTTKNITANNNENAQNLSSKTTTVTPCDNVSAASKVEAEKREKINSKNKNEITKKSDSSSKISDNSLKPANADIVETTFKNDEKSIDNILSVNIQMAAKTNKININATPSENTNSAFEVQTNTSSSESIGNLTKASEIVPETQASTTSSESEKRLSKETSEIVSPEQVSTPNKPCSPESPVLTPKKTTAPESGAESPSKPAAPSSVNEELKSKRLKLLELINKKKECIQSQQDTEDEDLTSDKLPESTEDKTTHNSVPEEFVEDAETDPNPNLTVDDNQDKDAIKTNLDKDSQNSEIKVIETNINSTAKPNHDKDIENCENDAIETNHKEDIESDAIESFEVEDEEMFDAGDGELTQVERESIDSQEYERRLSRTFSEEVTRLDRDDLENFNQELEEESNVLRQVIGKQERLATSITDQMNIEAQELLRMFGIPYIVSPMEAEAQCAFLDLSKLTHGSITEDSDIWLFGGQRVYKNVFNQKRHVELYTKAMVDSTFGLSRHALVNIALLCGSDYTNGVQGVGPVTALEIMAEFPGENLDGLKKFRKWWDATQQQMIMIPENKFRNKLRSVDLNSGFPSEAVVEAYFKPTVDDSLEPFSWGTPDLDLLRQFGKKKLGWSKDKVDELVKPLLKQLAETRTQAKISGYFQPESSTAPAAIKSQRIRTVLNKIKSKNQPVNEQDTDIIQPVQETKKKPRKPKEKAAEILKAERLKTKNKNPKTKKDIKFEPSSSDSSVAKNVSKLTETKSKRKAAPRSKGKVQAKVRKIKEEVALSESSSNDDEPSGQKTGPKSIKFKPESDAITSPHKMKTEINDSNDLISSIAKNGFKKVRKGFAGPKPTIVTKHPIKPKNVTFMYQPAETVPETVSETVSDLNLEEVDWDDESF